ncbi:hypothetical protein WA538_001556 [Blastocystis sp. DL]
MPSVLFVCLGNICRSPLAEGVMRNYLRTTQQSDLVSVDSAATSNYHTGETPHSGGQRCAKSHGIDISRHHARQVTKADFDKFDLVLGMDRSNIEDLQDMKEGLNPNGKAVIRMLSDFLPGREGNEVPDAYYARNQAACFEQIYHMIEDACPHIMDYLRLI